MERIIENLIDTPDLIILEIEDTLVKYIQDLYDSEYIQETPEYKILDKHMSPYIDSIYERSYEFKQYKYMVKEDWLILYNNLLFAINRYYKNDDCDNHNNMETSEIE
jgi:hypothetical protein